MPPKASIVNAAQPSLDGWLSVSGSAGASSSSSSAGGGGGALSTDSPALRTHSPPLLDKDSIFLASTFPLSAPPTTSSVRTLINLHLSPPRAEGLPKVVERGDGVMPSHRMYAWRCLTLRKGRRVLSGGEDDWEVKEGSEDDGEQYGGDRLLQVMRELGAVDCIVFCCRWFGGTLLGPIRFAHIQSTAKHALLSHLRAAELEPLLAELRARDARIGQLRSVLPPPLAAAPTDGASPVKLASSAKEADYSRLDQQKAERLLVARGRAIEGLEKKVAELKEAGRVERAAKGLEGLKRAAEAILVEDDSSEGEGDEARSGPGGLPAFKKRKGKEPAAADGGSADVVELDGDDSPPPRPTTDGPSATTTSTLAPALGEAPPLPPAPTSAANAPADPARPVEQGAGTPPAEDGDA